METILIVDDEERIRDLIGLYLTKEGFDVIKAENGIEAVDIFGKNGIELVILDIMMPIMDGWTALREIRKQSFVPVIMLTAKGEEYDKLLSFDLGTDTYITKPFSPKVLVANVKALLKRAYFNENKEENFDGLMIDELSHVVKIDDNEIYLTPKEFDLLNYLADNRGIVLERERILDKIWGIDYCGDLRTVDTHIKRLREKLSEKAYLIVTYRGTGYKFEVKNDKK